MIAVNKVFFKCEMATEVRFISIGVYRGISSEKQGKLALDIHR